MRLIQYDVIDRKLEIVGTNQLGDVFISACCFPIHGIHAGIYWTVNKMMKEISADTFDRIEGHSMGGSLGLEISRRTGKPVVAQGPFPIYWGNKSVNGRFHVYGNDIVPRLFPWFHFGCRVKMIPRVEKGNCFTDHVGY